MKLGWANEALVAAGNKEAAAAESRSQTATLGDLLKDKLAAVKGGESTEE